MMNQVEKVRYVVGVLMCGYEATVAENISEDSPVMRVGLRLYQLMGTLADDMEAGILSPASADALVAYVDSMIVVEDPAAALREFRDQTPMEDL